MFKTQLTRAVSAASSMPVCIKMLVFAVHINVCIM